MSTAEKIRKARQAAQQKKGRKDTAARDLEKCEVCGAGRTAIAYCVQCETRFCGVCDTQHHTGALTKHKVVPYSYKNRAGGAGGDDDDVALDPESEAVAVRHRAQLSELMYLLRHKVGANRDFLKHKLTKALDTQLRALVNGRLKDDFDELHKYLDERELAIATDIFNWRKVFFPQILANVRLVEDEMEHDEELAKRAEYALQQSNAFLLESTSAQELMGAMQQAVRRDNVVKQRQLESRINLSGHSAFGVEAVKRSVDRVYIARSAHDASGADSSAAGKTSFHVPVQATAAELDHERLHWAAAFGRLHQRMSSRLSTKFGDRPTLSVDVELDAVLRESIERLGATVVDDIVTELFHEFDADVPAATRRKLQDEVSDTVAALFGSAQAELTATAHALSRRMDYANTNRVAVQVVPSVWATYWEAAIRGAVALMVLERQPKPIALTAPADQALEAERLTIEQLDAVGDENAVVQAYKTSSV